jgi:HEAT repeat protein
MDKAMAALKTFDWSGNRDALEPILDAIVRAHSDPEALGRIETALLACLTGQTPRPGKEFICRQLAVMGSDRAVPVLGKLLVEAETADMARYALERLPGDAASQMLREALVKTKGTLRLGIVDSLGQRRDRGACQALAALLEGPDAALTQAAAAALGRIANGRARQALAAAKDRVPVTCRMSVLDAYLRCADALLARGRAAQAQAIYTELSGPSMPRAIQIAAKRGERNAKGIGDRA